MLHKNELLGYERLFHLSFFVLNIKYKSTVALLLLLYMYLSYTVSVSSHAYTCISFISYYITHKNKRGTHRA